MMNGWRRVFCTSIPKEKEDNIIGDSLETTSRFGFFSSPSTPRFQTRPVSSPNFSFQTFTAASSPTTVSLPNSPKLRCKTTGNSTPVRNGSPRSLLRFSSNPSSPISPASFSAALKTKLGFNKRTRQCGICLQSTKSGQAAAVFKAACSHSFHFHCIATGGAGNLPEVCPVCGSLWKESSPLSLSLTDQRPGSGSGFTTGNSKNNCKPLRVYNDDEPLVLSPISPARFNSIPETDENDDGESIEQDNGEFQGFFVGTRSPLTARDSDLTAKNVEVELSSESAIVAAPAAGKGFQTYAVVLKVRAPPSFPVARGNRWSTARRAPVDLVTVLDVGGKIPMMKRAMKLLISLLGDSDRLSIVVFSSISKRLLPLKRMTENGRRSARRVMDAFSYNGACEGMSVNDALKKAAKVIEDRRQRNVVTSIIVLSDGQNNPSPRAQTNPNRSPIVVSTTRLSTQQEIPVHNVWFSTCNHALPEDAFAKCVNGLLSVSVQSLNLELGLVSGSSVGEITSVYSVSGQPAWLGSGSGSIQLGDLYSDEERELLVEIRARTSTSSSRSHRILTVRSSYADPTTQDLIPSKDHALIIPRPQAVRSSPSITQLRNLHASRRAMAESRRLMDRNDPLGARRVLTSARTSLAQCGLRPADACVRELDAELADIERRYAACKSSNDGSDQGKEKVEPLTPTSAWRAAEKLAKVAIMKKHMNRVSDLHGFENARF